MKTAAVLLSFADLGCLVAASFLAGCHKTSPTEVALTRGECPSVCPDGTEIAFHRYEDGILKVGVCSASGGEVRWVENGPGMAAYPTWSPSGALVYTYGQEKGTAYEVFKGLEKASGYGLRVCERNGSVRDLLTGYTRDYLPSFSPDGKFVYFATTRGVKNESATYSLAQSSNLARVSFDGSGEPELVLRAPKSCNSGMAQPVISPDGKFLAWQHMRSFSPDGWTVWAGRLDCLNLDHAVQLTPEQMTALAPRWHPNGRYLAFTGFMPNDHGWGVWLMDLVSFGMRRLADGENPSFSPDGRWICYNRESVIYRRPLTDADYPTAADADRERGLPGETVVWSQENVSQESVFPVAGENFAVPSSKSAFVRASIVWNGEEGLQMYFTGEYEESGQGLLLYVDRVNRLWFASRTVEDAFRGVSVKLDKPGRYDVVGVRTSGDYRLAVNGAQPVVEGFEPPMGLQHPKAFRIGCGLKVGSSVKSIQFGFGLPDELRAAGEARRRLFK